LFATLDTTTHSLYLEQAGASVSLSDTVGFIRDLPHRLIEAFRRDAAGAADADLLLHVVDTASPVLDEQMAEVERVLAEIGAAGMPQILVYNKQDLLHERPAPARDRRRRSCAPRAAPRRRRACSSAPGAAPALAELRQLIAVAMQARPLIPDERDHVSTSSRRTVPSSFFLSPFPGMSSTFHTPPRSPSWVRRLMTPVARAAGRLLNNGRNDGPPDLDELWRDFNQASSPACSAASPAAPPARPAAPAAACPT
ncbi:MAG: protease modulator HflK N-terminal domain-containing protein, partial [Roseateles sp.]